MRILIVSDTHRREENYFTAVKKTQPLDMVIHCGDVEGSEDWIEAAADCPVIMVAGNNDFFSTLPREKEIMIGPYRAWVTHGHQYCVSVGSEIIKEEALARGVDIVIYGHTHKPLIDIEDRLTVLNPGSMTYPRQDGRRPSYILMEIDKNHQAHYHLNYL